MDISAIEQYIDRIYGFAVKHTFTRDEADELSQEILFTAVKNFPKLCDHSRFEPWLWGIAKNTAKMFSRRAGKMRALYVYVLPESMPEEAEEDTAELYAALRGKIAALSAMYRDIIIMYYYDCLSVKEIAAKLAIPEGTVTWRLSEGRKKLKKECTDMQETALRPKKLKIDIYGTGNYGFNNIPFPNEYISDALSQNILYYCYEEPKNAEELSALCGVPAYFVEERLENLVKRNAVTEAVRGKYQTDFIILSDKHGIYAEENMKKAVLPIAGRMFDALQAVAKEAAGLDFYRAEKSEAELFFLYGMMAFNHISSRFNKMPLPKIPQNYDGFWWRYIATDESTRHFRDFIGTQGCANSGSRGTYSYYIYRFGKFKFRKKLMYDLYINVCEDLLTHGKTEEAEQAACALRDGFLIKRENGELFVPIPAFPREAHSSFCEIAEKHLSPLMPEYTAIVEKYVKGFKKLFPPHLADDCARTCHSTFADMYAKIIEIGIEEGKISPPDSPYCEVMLQK